LQAGRLGNVSLDEVRGVFETNVFAVIAITQAVLPLLREAPTPRAVNLASSGGSLTLASDPADPRRARFGTYSVSKIALNALTVGFAADLETAGIKVNSADPGLTATELNNFLGTRTVSRLHMSLCVSRSSMPTVQLVHSRMMPVRSPGDVAVTRWSQGKQPEIACALHGVRSAVHAVLRIEVAHVCPDRVDRDELPNRPRPGEGPPEPRLHESTLRRHLFRLIGENDSDELSCAWTFWWSGTSSARRAIPHRLADPELSAGVSAARIDGPVVELEYVSRLVAVTIQAETGDPVRSRLPDWRVLLSSALIVRAIDSCSLWAGTTTTTSTVLTFGGRLCIRRTDSVAV
jgi:short chain dehydrogenase